MLSFAARPLDWKDAGKWPALAQAQTDWMVFTSPNGSATDHNLLNAITCIAANECWAVGDYSTDVAGQTLVEKWDGASWSIVSSPNTSPTQSNVLNDVTCASASDCWAVGFWYDGTFLHTLIERWNGLSWSIVASPNTSPTEFNELIGVTCSSANECWAVGYYTKDGVTQTLTEKWNGASWSIVISPNNGTTRTNVLNDVSCSSPNACWGVGYYNAGGFGQTLILFWNGAAWSVVSSPNADTARVNVLNSVTCVSANDCWAVGNGQRAGGSATDETLILRWQGALWDIVGSPNGDFAYISFLYDVTCTAADNCWAVGYYKSINPPQKTLIEKWDGASWSVVPSANAGSGDNTLTGVACVGPNACWAAGFSQYSFKTLVEGRFDLEIVSVARLANNHKLVNCLGTPGQVNNLQASPDLNPANFVTVSPPPLAADANGAFQYEDANPGSTRFYRLAFP